MDGLQSLSICSDIRSGATVCTRPTDRSRNVFALRLPIDRRPVGLDLATVSALRASIGEELRLQRGGGQLRPAAWNRSIVTRTVDGATPNPPCDLHGSAQASRPRGKLSVLANRA
jgi:hypothetical protein